MSEIQRFLESIVTLAHGAKDEDGEELRDTLDLIRGDIAAIERILENNEIQGIGNSDRGSGG